MAIIVQKFGGTSVGSVERIKEVALRIKSTVEEGHKVVVVVSARGGVTNELISRAREINSQPAEREMDMLLSIGEQETIALTAMALDAIGVPAVSRTGPQAGIVTDFAHTKARIQKIDGGDILDQLNQGNVVIVAGFQGMSKMGHITTLGRGGSDLSAIALAAAVKADLCQIYTDVDGVYTADPRIVPDACKLEEISYEEMLELASSGTKVMQSRAVEFAQKFNVVFEVRSSFNHNSGTIVKEEASLEDVLVSGVAIDKNQSKITVSGVPDRPGAAADIFQVLDDSRVIVDMIIQNVGKNGIANLSFTVLRDDVIKAKSAIEGLIEQWGSGQVAEPLDIAILSVVGVGMRSHSGVAATLFRALAENDINIETISTSEIKIAVAIDTEVADKATQVVHAAFGLDKLGS